MNFTKGILLGSAASLLSIAAASAADLPSRKSAPVEYVKVCSAYGAGFFFIPGTDTCLRIGGRMRADYGFVPGQNIYSGAGTAGTADTSSSASVASAAGTGSSVYVTGYGEGSNVGIVVYSTVAGGGTASAASVGSVAGLLNDGAAKLKTHKNGEHTFGWEARARINFDARTQTAWGTVQAAAGIRLARSNGVFDVAAAETAGSSGTPAQLEYAYVRFAGFTFGASRDNFAFMPSLTYGAGHWASFGNGAQQIAYTATLGGGLSATVAVQAYTDTGTKPVDGTTDGSGYVVLNTAPQLNGTINLNQSWGALQLMGAVAQVQLNTAKNEYDQNKTVYAVGAGAKFNLPMLSNASALYLTGAYANGMTEYTTNYTSFKGSAFKRDVGGYQMNHPSLYATDTGIETVKSWSVAALLEHYWAPQWRSVLFGSYGQLDANATAKANVWNGTTGFGDATVWSVGKQFAWLPTKDFEVGVEVIYSRVNQDVLGYVDGPFADGKTLMNKADHNFTGRLRVERNF